MLSEQTNSNIAAVLGPVLVDLLVLIGEQVILMEENWKSNRGAARLIANVLLPPPLMSSYVFLHALNSIS